MGQEETLRGLKKDIESAKHIVFFGGAGVSTESGIPDFRGAEGLYREKGAKIPPEEILSRHFFFEHTADFYCFYRDKMLPLDAKPNAAHLFLAELERKGKRVSVVTQNIDGLHQKAGSKEVYELHGSIWHNHCLTCGHEVDATYMRDYKGAIPLCPVCGGLLKPDVVLYEEALPEEAVEGTIEALEDADLLLVAGTSLTVYPAASFLRYYGGSKVYAINLSPLPEGFLAEGKELHFILGKVGETLSSLQRLK